MVFSSTALARARASLCAIIVAHLLVLAILNLFVLDRRDGNGSPQPPNDVDQASVTAMLAPRPPLLALPNVKPDIILVNRPSLLRLSHPDMVEPLAWELWFQFNNGWVPPRLLHSGNVSTNLECHISPISTLEYPAKNHRFPMDFGSNLMGGPAFLLVRNNQSAFIARFNLTLYVTPNSSFLADHLPELPTCSRSNIPSVLALLNQTQHPKLSECGSQRYVDHRFINTGLGVNLVFGLVHEVHFAMQHNPPAFFVTPQTTTQWKYTAVGCPSNFSVSAFACLFAPTSPCMTLSQMNASLVLPLPRGTVWESHLSYSANDSLNPYLLPRSPPCEPDFLGPRVLVYSAILAFFTPPRADLESFFAERLAQAGVGPAHGYNCVAVHVRQGERGNRKIRNPNGALPRYELEDVLRVVRPIVLDKRVANVVLVSDGTQLLEDANRYNGTDLHLHTMDAGVRRAKDGGDCLREASVGCSVRQEEARLAMLLDLEALCSCKYFVGTFASTFTRLAYMRGIGRGVIVSAPISFD
jgi:hypothetical protein